jgi:hypothetical protein
VEHNNSHSLLSSESLCLKSEEMELNEEYRKDLLKNLNFFDFKEKEKDLMYVMFYLYVKLFFFFF